MHSEDQPNQHNSAQQNLLVSALVKKLDESVRQLPASTQAALAEGRARALRRQKTPWPWAMAASVLLVFSALAWNYQPQDSDAMALELLQTDDQLLNELDFLESIAEVDDT